MQFGEFDHGHLPAWLKARQPVAVPAWLGALLEVVMRDMQLPHPVPTHIAWEALTEDAGTLWFCEVDENGGCGTELTRETDDTDADRLVGLAWFLQDQFFPETQAAWGEARPACPGHPHPATPEVHNGEAWWICPAGSGPIARIGELGRMSS